MSTPAKKPPAAGFPPSPCVDVCRLDENEVCIGCGRSISEIARWPLMTAEEQWRVVNALAKRET